MELNVVVESEEATGKLLKLYENVRGRAKPIDPKMELGKFRYFKMKFWEKFLFASEQLMSKKRQYDVEWRLKEFMEIKERFEKQYPMKNEEKSELQQTEPSK